MTSSDCAPINVGPAGESKIQPPWGGKMKALIPILLISLGGSLPAKAAAKIDSGSTAQTMTCTRFKAGLAASIVSGGSKVIVPDPSDKADAENGSSFVRYAFHNVAGVEGDLDCDDSDRFESIQMKSKFEAMNADGFKRYYRLQALVVAALCVEINFTQQVCAEEVSGLFASARRAMAADDLRGGQNPIGDVTRDYPDVAKIEVRFSRGEIWISLSAAKH